jgi:hypothetical protein
MVTFLLSNTDLVILVCQMKRSGRVLPVKAEDLARRPRVVLEAAARRCQPADELSDLDSPGSLTRGLAQVEVQVQNVSVGRNIKNGCKQKYNKVDLYKIMKTEQ